MSDPISAAIAIVNNSDLTDDEQEIVRSMIMGDINKAIGIVATPDNKRNGQLKRMIQGNNLYYFILLHNAFVIFVY